MNVNPSQHIKPSLPAIAAAVLFFIIWGWSALVVQPRMAASYQERCDDALFEAELIDANGKLRDLTNWLADETPEKLVSRRKSLNDASLYLRRLIDVTPNVNQLILQLAYAADASAQLNTKLSATAMSNGETFEAESLRRKAMLDNELAKDTMARLSRGDSDEAMMAKSWELASTLKRSVRDESSREQLERIALAILERDPRNRIGRVRLGQLRTMQAYSLERTSDSDQRDQEIRKAVELLADIESPSMIEQAFLAEAQDALTPEQSIQTSIAVSQRFWAGLSSETQSPEGLASLFSCLLRLGSLQESQSLVATKLPTLSPDEQYVLRGLCSDYCLRNIECQVAFPSDVRQLKSIDALSIATRIDAQSPAVQILLERLIFNSVEDALSQQLFNDLSNGNDTSLLHLILAIRSALEDQWSVSRNETRISLEADIGSSATAAFLMGRLLENGSATKEQAIQFLEDALEIAPEATSLSFACAVFFEKHNELEKASKCLESILAKKKNDSQILAILATIYSRLDRTEDVKRIQLELQKLRKQPK